MTINYMLGCYENYCVEKFYLLLLIIPLFFILLYFMYKDFIKFNDPEGKKKFRKRKKGLRLSMLITRTLIFFMLLLAFANPYTAEETTTHGDPVVKLLIDNTESMDIFDPELVDKIKEKFQGKVPIEISQISSGKRSELGEGIIKRIQGNDNLLIVSDGNNNHGKTLLDVGVYAGISDTRLFAIDSKPVRNDAYVRIIGPSETIKGTQNQYKVMVDFVGAQPSFTLQVYIDDRLEFSGENVFERNIYAGFSEGYHKITAKIIIKDYFEQNNEYYMTVKTVPKPKILFVSRKESPMKEGLSNIYEMTVVSKLPGNIEKYQAIIFNDISHIEIENKVDDLTGYLLDGAGIIFIGGGYSFDKGDYEETLLESLLPVKMGAGKIVDPLKNNIVIVL